MTEYLIQARHLKKSFGAVRAVNDLSLQVAAGEIYGLVGADGAGKTTTLRLLVGALRAEAGEILISGYRLPDQVEQARARLGYLSQRFSLYEDLTVLENIRFFAEVRGLRRREWLPRCREILDFVGLRAFENRRAGHLSGGMKQKLGLATALVTRPRVLLLDEPTTGVDPLTRQDFWQLIIRLVAPGHPSHLTDPPEPVAVLLSTPYMDEAARCHRVGFMKEGRLIAEDTPSGLRARLNGRVLELRGEPRTALRHLAQRDPDIEQVAAFGDRLHLRIRPGCLEQVMARLPSALAAQGIQQVELRPISPTLEDVFIALSET